MSDPNGYAEPFKQLLAVAQESARESTEQTILLRQIAGALDKVEERHRSSSAETRRLLVDAVEAHTKALSVQVDNKAGEIVGRFDNEATWWHKAVWVMGIAMVVATLLGAGSQVWAIIERFH